MNKKIKELTDIISKASRILEELKSEPKEPIKRGDVVKAAGVEWIVLKINENKVTCVMKEFNIKKMFDSNSNNYANSSIRKYLNKESFEEIIEHVSEDLLYPIETDLLSLDGQKEYGTVSDDKVSILTVDQYRENRDILPNMDKWWWLATPWSTKCNGIERMVCCVSDGGDIDGINCSNDFMWVRPVCIFDSSIFES